MQIESFYKYIYKQVSFEYKTKSDKFIQKETDFNLYQYLKFFPHFPDIDLINNLSCENYERKKCDAKLVFLPFENNIDSYPTSFLYENDKIAFEEKNRRLIRKILESLDELHVLVLGYDNVDDKYYIRGVVKKTDISEYFTNYYFIHISDYLNWSAKCKYFNLFDYDKGKFREFNHILNDFNQITNILTSFNKNFSTPIDNLQNILNIIYKQQHGTSFIVFKESGMANSEAERLFKAERGFKLKNIMPYDKLVECLPQLIKVDGGLILDEKLNCYAYGCIYDGRFDTSFKGSLARGSRYNSTQLYVCSLNNNSTTCYGVVFSDDGGVECVE